MPGGPTRRAVLGPRARRARRAHPGRVWHPARGRRTAGPARPDPRAHRPASRSCWGCGGAGDLATQASALGGAATAICRPAGRPAPRAGAVLRQLLRLWGCPRAVDRGRRSTPPQRPTTPDDASATPGPRPACFARRPVAQRPAATPAATPARPRRSAWARPRRRPPSPESLAWARRRAPGLGGGRGSGPAQRAARHPAGRAVDLARAVGWRRRAGGHRPRHHPGRGLRPRGGRRPVASRRPAHAGAWRPWRRCRPGRRPRSSSPASRHRPPPWATPALPRHHRGCGPPAGRAAC